MMFKSARRVRIALVATLALAVAPLAACGDDDDNTGSVANAPPISTGVPAQTAVRDLEPAEATQICESVQEAVDRIDTEKMGCTVFGILFAPDPTECRKIEQDCLNDEEGFFNDGETEHLCDEQLLNDASECGVTVGELEACFGQGVAQLDLLVKKLTCNLAGKSEAEMQRAMGDADMPPACAVVEEKCPGLLQFDDDEDDDDF